MENRAARKIQRAFRRCRPINATCSLTMEPLEFPIFRFYSNGRTKRPIAYTLRPLLDYFKVSGKLVDPCTRKKYELTDLERIDRIMNYFQVRDHSSPLAAIAVKMAELRGRIFATFNATMRPSQPLLQMMIDLHLSPLLYALSDQLDELRGISDYAAVDMNHELLYRAHGEQQNFSAWEHVHEFMVDAVIETLQIRLAMNGIEHD